MTDLERAADALDTPTSRYRPYDEYRDSETKILGCIPAHWEVRKLKTVAELRTSNIDKKSDESEMPVRLCNYTDVYYNDFITSEMELMEATASKDQIRRFELRAGDVIITKDSESADDIAVAAFVPADLPGVVCGYHLALIRPYGDLVGRYLFRAFGTYPFASQFEIGANGITRYGLSQAVINDAWFVIPPPDEQRAIAAFLDRETAKLDALIAKKRDLIASLTEQRSAIISHAVTKGLDPDAPMKDSGVEWLGEIPAAWEVRRLKHISPSLSVGLVINPSTYVDEEGTVPFLFGSNVTSHGINIDGSRRITEQSNQLLKPSMLFTGDLVTIRVGYPGVTAVVPPELDGSNCASIMITRKSKQFVSEWLCYTFNSYIGKVNIDLVAYGAAQKQFNISHAVEFVFPFPSLQEQYAIVDHLDAMSNSIDTLIAKAEETIAMLQEYRAALISAAVTGKIDVRGEV